MQIYQLDNDLILMGDGEPRGVHSKGHLQVLVVPPARPAGKLARWDTDLCPARDTVTFGEAGTGAWVLEADHRKTPLYLTADGQTYTVGTEIEQGTYPGYGDLPAWLTDIARPNQFHNWVKGAWVLDAAAKLDNDKAMERAWRDSRISAITWMRDRHRDEIEQDLTTTLTEEQYGELVVYIQALRDWPAAAAFPAPVSRPPAPQWLIV
jgi:hypothetical protein